MTKRIDIRISDQAYNQLETIAKKENIKFPDAVREIVKIGILVKNSQLGNDVKSTENWDEILRHSALKSLESRVMIQYVFKKIIFNEDMIKCDNADR